jgi:hypothetical protein
MTTKSYRAGAAIRNTTVSASKAVASGAKGAGHAARMFWKGLSGATVATTAVATRKPR